MYSMKECCSLTGLSYDTLKYYCNQGLVPNVKRDKYNNYRIFNDEDINWIKSLICLKKCNFSMSEMKEYISLCEQGKDTLIQRKQMLVNHRKEIENEIESLNSTLAFIDYKTSLYDKLMSGEIEYSTYFKQK